MSYWADTMDFRFLAGCLTDMGNPTKDEQKAMSDLVPESDKENLFGELLFAGALWLTTSEQAGAPDVIKVEDLQKRDGNYYYVDSNNKEREISKETVENYQKDIKELKKIGGVYSNGYITLPLEDKNYKLDLIRNGALELISGEAVNAGAKYIYKTPAGKYIVNKAGKVTTPTKTMLEKGSKEGLGNNLGALVSEAERKSRKTVHINNPVLTNIRTGSASKQDALHAFNNIIDNYASYADEFDLVGGDGISRKLYQIEGSLNEKKGIFEWIVDPDIKKGVTHRRFIEGVKVTGSPNAYIKKMR